MADRHAFVSEETYHIRLSSITRDDIRFYTPYRLSKECLSINGVTFVNLYYTVILPRKWRREHERYGKFNPTNYNLDGNLEGTLNFIYWKCDCCQDGFQRVRPVLHETNLFVDEGQNVMVKGDKDTQPRKVPLCNRCIALYRTKGWLVTREK